MMMNIAIFASGSGSNMENITRYFMEKERQDVAVTCMITDQKEAFVQERAKRLGVPSYYLSSKELADPDVLLPLLAEHEVDVIILAGYLCLIPEWLLAAYPDRILNIHPALLPKYGGKGMYGMNVHRAVHDAGERESGITIHIIDEKYDEGTTLFQARVAIDPDDTPDQIAEKVHQLEMAHYPEVIEQYLYKLCHSKGN